MKNKKHFQKWMLSAAALLMVAPLANQSQHVHASMNDAARRPGITSTYGIAPYADPKMHKKGGYRGSAGEMSIVLNYDYYGVNGTANANYVHDHLLSGFLVRNGKIHGQPFGPVSLQITLRNDKLDKNENTSTSKIFVQISSNSTTRYN